jgi:diguanylate cyclase
VAGAKNIAELSDVVTELLTDVRTVGSDVRHMHEELERARRDTEEKDREVHRLQVELQAVSQQVRHDPLTSLLNRRGFEESIRVEYARADRTRGTLAVAMLDLDNFKAVNSRLGHAGGDGALTHLARMLRKHLRPTDIVCRYGGEEFVILMPHTDTEEGVKAMVRLQRELTKRFFLHGNERVFITFSAGVAQRRDGESHDAVVERADRAMREAKATGKNRVVKGA